MLIYIHYKHALLIKMPLILFIFWELVKTGGSVLLLLGHQQAGYEKRIKLDIPSKRVGLK